MCARVCCDPTALFAETGLNAQKPNYSAPELTTSALSGLVNDAKTVSMAKIALASLQPHNSWSTRFVTARSGFLDPTIPSTMTRSS
jgi:hypothetical protein